MNDRAEHRRRMRAGLQEQRIGDDGAAAGKGQQARDHVLRAVQQHAHRKTALGLDGGGGPRGGGAASRHRLCVFLGTFLHLNCLFLRCGSVAGASVAMLLTGCGASGLLKRAAARR